MDKLKIFKSNEFGKIEIYVDKNGKEWFPPGHLHDGPGRFSDTRRPLPPPPALHTEGCGPRFPLSPSLPFSSPAHLHLFYRREYGNGGTPMPHRPFPLPPLSADDG